MGSFPFGAVLPFHMCIPSHGRASRAKVVPPFRIGCRAWINVSDTANVCYALFPSVNTKQDKQNPNVTLSMDLAKDGRAPKRILKAKVRAPRYGKTEHDRAANRLETRR